MTVSGIPGSIKPMLARLTSESFDSNDHIFELKWDGYRAIAFVADGRLKVHSRSLKDLTGNVPELEELPDLLRHDNTVLDGELVCFDESGKPNFSLLQSRLNANPDPFRSGGPAISFVVFDVLYDDGVNVMAEPLMDRKARLAETLSKGSYTSHCEYIENEGLAFFDASIDLGMEGMIAKRKSSLYFPGQRSHDWHKVKGVFEHAFVVGGFDLVGSREDSISSLLLGLYDGDRLRFVGGVGSGFTEDMRRGLKGVLDSIRIDEMPFDSEPDTLGQSYWCEPVAVCRVKYAEFTPQGHLRHPVFLDIADDTAALDCVLESAPGWQS